VVNGAAGRAEGRDHNGKNLHARARENRTAKSMRCIIRTRLAMDAADAEYDSLHGRKTRVNLVDRLFFFRLYPREKRIIAFNHHEEQNTRRS